MKNINADGLRGLAAFNVTVSHFIAAFFPSAMHHSYPEAFKANPDSSILYRVLTSPVFSVLYNGNFAVFIFFVLSGYVLTLPHYVQDDSSTSLKKRLWGRYIRLNLAIFAAVMLSYGLYVSGLYVNSTAAGVSGSSWLGYYFQPGLTFLLAIKESIYQSILLGSGTFVPPLWTLRIEFIGSLYVLLFYICKPTRYMSVLLIPVCILMYAIHAQDSIYFYGIFLGSLLSRFQPSQTAKFILLVIGLYFGGFQFDSSLYDFLPRIGMGNVEVWKQKDFYNLIGACSITAAVIHGFGARIFQARIVQFLGRISYSIYLLHFLVLCSLASALCIYLPAGIVFLLSNFAIYLLVCIMLSVVFERFVDRPAINLSHRFTSMLFTR